LVAKNSHLGLYSAGNLGNGSPQVESIGEARQGWGLGDDVPQKLCRHCLQILTAETIKIWKFCSIHLLIL